MKADIVHGLIFNEDRAIKSAVQTMFLSATALDYTPN
jgi:hypothetical protein